MAAQIDDSAGVLNIRFTQGNDRTYPFEFYDLDTDDPINITADDFTLTVFNPDRTEFEVFTVGDGLEITDDHIVAITLPAALTDTMTAGPYPYNLDWTRDGLLFTPFVGCITVTPKM